MLPILEVYFWFPWRWCRFSESRKGSRWHALAALTRCFVVYVSSNCAFFLVHQVTISADALFTTAHSVASSHTLTIQRNSKIRRLAAAFTRKYSESKEIFVLRALESRSSPGSSSWSRAEGLVTIGHTVSRCFVKYQYLDVANRDITMPH
ncbi:hypothetical protein IW262DRAFT_206573 [Armillaria fumosa]|nr:hypothetical protein IW262DRAFT_206573 [Armillaria fumosa]